MKAVKHVLTITLALLMILSSTGLTLAAHLCKGELKALAFSQTESCCSKKAQKTQPPHCPDHPLEQGQEQSSDTEDCCKTLQISAEIPEEAIQSLRMEQLQQDQAAPAFVAAYLLALLQPATAPDNTDFSHYPPPSPVRDIPVLVQSFLL